MVYYRRMAPTTPCSTDQLAAHLAERRVPGGKRYPGLRSERIADPARPRGKS